MSYSCKYAYAIIKTLKKKLIVAKCWLRVEYGGNMANVNAVASYFISRSSELNENDLTNLKLQKLLYYAQAECVKSHTAKIFNEPIEAWDYGPVVSSVYKWLKGCGAYPITTFDVTTDFSSLSKSQVLFLDTIWDK